VNFGREGLRALEEALVSPELRYHYRLPWSEKNRLPIAVRARMTMLFNSLPELAGCDVSSLKFRAAQDEQAMEEVASVVIMGPSILLQTIARALQGCEGEPFVSQCPAMLDTTELAEARQDAHRERVQAARAVWQSTLKFQQSSSTPAKDPKPKHGKEGRTRRERMAASTQYAPGSLPRGLRDAKVGADGRMTCGVCWAPGQFIKNANTLQDLLADMGTSLKTLQDWIGPEKGMYDCSWRCTGDSDGCGTFSPSRNNSHQLKTSYVHEWETKDLPDGSHRHRFRATRCPPFAAPPAFPQPLRCPDPTGLVSSPEWQQFLTQAEAWVKHCESLHDDWDEYDHARDLVETELGEARGFVPRAEFPALDPADWACHPVLQHVTTVEHLDLAERWQNLWSRGL